MLSALAFIVLSLPGQELPPDDPPVRTEQVDTLEQQFARIDSAFEQLEDWEPEDADKGDGEQ